MTELALGTAQFGLDYGVANTEGQVSLDSAADIIAFSREIGIGTIDTAISYGESEEVLGKVGVTGFRVNSKLPEIPATVDNVNRWVAREVADSISRLNVTRLDGLLLHRPAQLNEPRGVEIIAALLNLKSANLVEKIGVSIYSPSELHGILDHDIFDIVQCPFNIVDQRFSRDGWFEQLKNSGIEIHTRSAFLQGLLLMPRPTIPGKFEVWGAIWDEWHDWLTKNKITPLEACLQFAFSDDRVDRIIVGVNSLAELKQIHAMTKDSVGLVFPDISCVDEYLINPSNWGSL